MDVDHRIKAIEAESTGGRELGRYPRPSPQAEDQGNGHLPAVRPMASGYEEPRGYEPGPPDAMVLWKAFRRCGIAAAGVGLIFAGVAGLMAWFVTPSPKFVARATLQVASTSPKILSTPGGDRADFGTYLRTQTALLKSRLVLKGVLDGPEVAALPLFREVADPFDWLEKELSIESTGGSELLKVSLKGDYPRDLATVVNGLATFYLREAQQQEARERAERLRSLTENHERYLADREERRAALKNVTEDVGSNDRRSISVKQELDLERLDLTRRELMEIQSELRRGRVELGVLEAQARSGVSGGLASTSSAEEVASDPVVGSQSARIADLETRLASARRTIRSDGDPAIRRLLDELESTRKGLATRRGEVIRTNGKRAGELATQDMASRITSSRERVAILEEHERLLDEEVNRLSEESRLLNRSTIVLENSRGEMDQADDMVRKISQEIEAQRVEMMAPSRVRLLEQAEVPRKRDGWPRIKTTCLAAGGAFALTLLTLTWRESQVGRVDSIRVVRGELGLKLLGVLPKLNDKNRRLVDRPDPSKSSPQAALYFESIEATREMVLRVFEGKPSGIVLIASALPAEGKTSLSCHLAASLARAGKSTLLIDGDLRIPSAHKVLNLTSNDGISEVLRGEVTLDEAIRPTEHEGLMFLPAGECDTRALDALGRGKVGEILGEIRNRFEIVVVDSAPILPVSDSIHFARHCDTIIFSVLEDVSTVSTVRAAFDRLGALDVPVLGAVVAGSPLVHYKYRYNSKPVKQNRQDRPAAAAPQPSRRPSGPVVEIDPIRE